MRHDVTAIRLSGFADEIDPDLNRQLAVVSELGMKYIILRTANGKNIADYTAQQADELLLPLLTAADIGVSCLGSPIGKIPLEDEAAFTRQCEELAELCRIANLLNCRYIRVFSFYLPEGKSAEHLLDAVVAKLNIFVDIGAKHDIILLHENEKDIFGDTADRCVQLLNSIDSPHFRAAFDFANFVQCGERPMDAWQQLSPYVADIHIKDALFGGGENVLCGTGDGSIEAVLRQALGQDRFTGFLSLEPHLVLFDGLQALELHDAAEIIRENKAANGADGYTMQHQALTEILERL